MTVPESCGASQRGFAQLLLVTVDKCNDFFFSD